MTIDLYDFENHRKSKAKIHFGLGRSVHAVCGTVLRSRRAMVHIGSSWDGILITDDFTKVTCERCKKTRTLRLVRLLAIEAACPGIFDRPSLCGEKWLLEHALDVSQDDIEALTLEIETDKRRLKINSKLSQRDQREILRGLSK